MKYALILFFIGLPFAQANQVDILLHKTTYRIYSNEWGGEGHGTGVAVKTKRNQVVILTNWHVCLLEGQHKLTAENEYYGTNFEVTILAKDPSHDLCAVSIHPTAEAVKLAKSAPKFHSPLSSAGYPASSGKNIRVVKGKTLKEVLVVLTYLIPYGECPTTETVFSYFENSCYLRLVLQDTTLAAEPGSSGSPALNSQGQLVGLINSTSLRSNHKFGSMIPFRDVAKFLNRAF